MRSYPKVQLSLIEGCTSNVLAQLRRGELSLALVTDPAPDPLLEYTELFTESLYLVGSIDDPRLKKRSLDAASLGNLPLVMSSKHNRSRQLIENSTAREGAKLDIRLEMESSETLRQLLASGRIYGLVPYSSVFPRSAGQAARRGADQRADHDALSRQKPHGSQFRWRAIRWRRSCSPRCARWENASVCGRVGIGVVTPQRERSLFLTTSPPHPGSHLTIEPNLAPPGEGGHPGPHSGISHGVENTLWWRPIAT